VGTRGSAQSSTRECSNDDVAPKVLPRTYQPVKPNRSHLASVARWVTVVTR
jgi:hypothetical protein